MTTVRTIKLKRNPQGTTEPMSLNTLAPETAPADQPDATVAAAASPSPAAAPVAVAQASKGATVSRKSYFPYTIAAALVVVIFLAIIGLQYTEMSLYQAEPSVWVHK